MTDVRQITARWAAIAALTTSCALALSACEQNTVPNSEPAAAAPPQASAELMGAPDGGSTRTTPYAPPPGAQGPAPDAPPAYPPPPPYASAPRPATDAPSEVIAMAPIPNPPEEPRHTHHWRPYHHPYHRQGWWGPAFSGRPAPMRHHRHHARVRQLATTAAPAARPMAPAKPLHPARHAAAAALAAAGAAHLTHVHAPPTHHPDKADVSAASGGSSTSTPPATATAGARYDALTTALATVFGHEANLNVPAHMPADQASDVSLTVPGDFAQTLATEAGKQNMLNEAASANLEATLVGDGYIITPVESQAQAVTLGEPTVFHWKVAPQGAVQGPLHADARLTLLASGRSLALGSIKASGASKGVGRIIGIGLLVLIALVLIGWVLRNRRPAPSGAIRPRPQNKPPFGI